MNALVERAAKFIFFLCACTSLLALAIILFFIFSKGLPAIIQIGPVNFLLGLKWEPQQGLYGILPMMLASIVVTFFSFTVGAIIGKWAAIFLAFYCPKILYTVLKPMVELLAGIPSVIYGFFGVVVIVPLIRDNLGGAGKSMLAAIIILCIMILPTIINVSESALRAIPPSYYEGALSLGCTHNEAVFKVIVPAAKSGITASYVLGMGRAFGETMAVILVAGNNPRMPVDMLKPVRTLTSGIATEMSYASGLHQEALFGIGVVLFIFIMVLNSILQWLYKKERNV